MSEEKIEYRGCRQGAEAVVVKIVDDRSGSLNPRLDLRNHSPDGPEWGYFGSGPAQLSLAILADALKDDARALRLYQDYKRIRIGVLPIMGSWALTREQVLSDVSRIEAGDV